MKKFTQFSIIVLALTTMNLAVQSQNRSTVVNPAQSFAGEAGNPDWSSDECLRGVITIKLKKGVGEFGKQTGTVRFGISSLDNKVTKFKVFQLEKRFRYNPAKLRADLPDLSRIYKISFPDDFAVNEVASEFSSDPNVEYAEPIPVYHTDDVPNDVLYSQLQHLPQIHAPQAWDIHKGENGTTEIVIAIDDTGVDWDHEDLLSNIWQNLAEDADNDGHTLEFTGQQWVLDPGDLNGIDDDANGFTDDLIGWNFITNNGDPNPITGNPVGFHGTHCAGISNSATNNGTGIASISWNLKMMPICADANNTIPFAYNALIYAAENGADIISNSWGGSIYSIADQEVVNYVTGLGSFMSASAGNKNSNELHYPSSYIGVISVASVSSDDKKASYSNHTLSVDISAPGGGSEGGILSAMPGNGYGLLSGTSMATPLIAGCFGLLKSYHPDWSNVELMTKLLGTADNIDSLNPDYINMLGTGRVNAYRMLTSEIVVPYLKLGLISFTGKDANGNFINEPGETVTLNFSLRNYMQCYGSENVDVTLMTDDPDITIIDGTGTVNIPPDNFFSIENQFEIQVGLNAQSHFAEFTLYFDADIPITVGEAINFSVLVAPSGIFVFEGEENSRDYSGTLTAGFLDHLGYNYTYSNTYPATLLGFETAFLSHGNFGQNLDKGTMFTEDHSLKVQEFLEHSGKVYVEMGGMFYRMSQAGYQNLAQMKQLFGVNAYTNPMLENPVDTLLGVENTPMEGMMFTRSDQLFNWYIDKLFPTSGALVPFDENNYGNVAVMNDGSATYGHKTFYMGYSLAGLRDRDATSSGYNVLLKTMEFFGYSPPQGFILSNFIADKTIGGPPLAVQFTDISISDPVYPVISWQWDFENDDTIDSDDQNPARIFDEAGTFDVKLITSNGLNSDTLIVEACVTINSGYLVYEGVASGNDYSGSFIRDYLQENEYPVTYRNILPDDLEGFTAVFLSFGNYLSGNTILNNQMAGVIKAYLEGGGYVYLEGSNALGYDQAGDDQLHQLFGLAAAFDGAANPIDFLAGQPGSLTHEMQFTGNSQTFNSSIDIYVPFANADAAFTESNYGVVAVQHSIPNSSRTFCFSYSLSNLNDGEMPNTREELLQRILNYFDIYSVVPDVGKITTLSCSVYPNPFSHTTLIGYQVDENTLVTLTIFNHLGQQVAALVEAAQTKGKYQIEWNAENLPSGVYYCRLKTGNQLISKKIIKMN